MKQPDKDIETDAQVEKENAAIREKIAEMEALRERLQKIENELARLREESARRQP